MFSLLVYLEVYASREKNGVYMPKERYYQEESEKKVLSLCTIVPQIIFHWLKNKMFTKPLEDIVTSLLHFSPNIICLLYF